MTTAFDRLDRIASRAVDRVLAQRFILRPMISRPNTRGAPDPNRPLIEGRGVFEYLPVDVGLQLGVRKSYREANDMRTLQTTREPVLSIDRGVWFPDRKFLPKQGDIVEIPDDEGEPDFIIVSVQPDGQSRVVLKLNILGAP